MDPQTKSLPPSPDAAWPAPRELDPALATTGGMSWLRGLTLPMGGEERCLDRRMGASRRHRIAVEGVICERRKGETRRKNPRILVKLVAEAHMGNVCAYGMVLDLSTGGLFFHTATPFGMGERITVDFALPGTDLAIKCIGEVVAVVRSGMGQGPSGNSLRFCVIRPGHRKAMVEFIRHRIEEEALEVIDPGALRPDLAEDEDEGQEVSLLGKSSPFPELDLSAEDVAPLDEDGLEVVEPLALQRASGRPAIKKNLAADPSPHE